MSSQINKLIGTQAFEVIRDRIAQILAIELENQVVNFGNYDADVDVWIERFQAFDKTELPAVNVTFAPAEFSGKSAPQNDGSYTFNIDCYYNAKSDNDTDGATIAMLKLQRLLGVCRSIMDNPAYLKLGFSTPFIMSVKCTSMAVKEPTAGDALTTMMGRLVYAVKASEVTPLLDGEAFSGFDTIVKISNTDKGYLYSANSFPLPNSTKFGVENIIKHCFNDTAETIAKGRPVKITGAQSGLPMVEVAMAADNHFADAEVPYEALGIAAQDITPGGYGVVLIQGTLQYFNTAQYSGGPYLYVSEDGLLTDEAPEKPLEVIPVGIITKTDDEEGEIYVVAPKVIHLNDISGFDVKNIADGEIFYYNDTTKTVKNTALKTINGQSLFGAGNITITASAVWGGISGNINDQTDLITKFDTKVDKVSGKGLSTNDLTDILKAAYDAAVLWITTNGTNLLNHLTDTNNPHNVTATQVGLGNVDNTSDVNKPISSATQTALNAKQDSLGYTAENSANKTETVTGNETSTTKYLSIKGIYDWVISLGYITSSALSNYLQKNSPITGSTKTKITYDSNGLVTSGSDATTADIADSTNKRYVTDANLTVISNTSGTNTGDNATNNQYSGLASSKQDALTATNFGTFSTGLTSKTTPVGADTFNIYDSVATIAKKLSLTDLGTYLATLFVSKPLKMYITTGNQTNGTNTPADITGMSVSLAANKRYRVHGCIMTLGVAGGIRIGTTLPTSSTSIVFGTGQTSSTTAFVSRNFPSAGGDFPVTTYNTSASDSIMNIIGEVTTGANAGTFKFYFYSNTNGNTSTIYQQGTLIEISEI